MFFLEPTGSCPAPRLPPASLPANLPACAPNLAAALVPYPTGAPHAFQLKYWLNRSTGADSPSKRMYILEGTAGFAAAQRLRAASCLAFYAAPGGRLVSGGGAAVVGLPWIFLAWARATCHEQSSAAGASPV